MGGVMKMKKDNLDFEISFYEGLIQKKSDFVEALFLLGDLYTKKGLYKKGLEVDKKLVKLRPYDPVVYYNLSCDYSLLRKIDSSLKALRKALELGFRDFRLIEKDPDLEFLRKDKRFEILILEFKKGIKRKFKSFKKIKSKDISQY
jgi:tetratricopeptide (TPR) repeat protein